MDTIPEINCASCNQSVPVDRDCCPFCRTDIKSYFYENQGEIIRAVPFSENGKDYLFIDGKKWPLDDLNRIPYPLQLCLKESKAMQPKKKSFLGGVMSLFVTDTPLDQDGSPVPMPSEWDDWLKY